MDQIFPDGPNSLLYTPILCNYRNLGKLHRRLPRKTCHKTFALHKVWRWSRSQWRCGDRINRSDCVEMRQEKDREADAVVADREAVQGTIDREAANDPQSRPVLRPKP